MYLMRFIPSITSTFDAHAPLKTLSRKQKCLKNKPWIRDGAGQDFLDPTGKFQNLRRLTGRSTGF